ncbi:unnamed protein product [Arctia plantaginis]|uniref:Uncharacterized protein n=1 Tax=Arctia plantaginis TaxID=874455 RepID=A0A8S1BL51_ARCPL|nr:unnamed protein product [Arctia plantaginis]
MMRHVTPTFKVGAQGNVSFRASYKRGPITLRQILMFLKSIILDVQNAVELISVGLCGRGGVRRREKRKR